MTDATPLIIPALGGIYQALAPWTEALLRAAVGLALVPHGLRNTFGFWPGTPNAWVRPSASITVRSPERTRWFSNLDQSMGHP